MKCDTEPCKNGGICTENFSKQESSCDCELTSYFGEYCMEEKGADFNGESILQRKFVLSGPILKVLLSTNNMESISISISVLTQTFVNIAGQNKISIFKQRFTTEKYCASFGSD